jgi:hypothetical protein
VNKFRWLYGVVQLFRAHIFITLPHKRSEFEIKLASVLINGLLKVRWILLFLHSERDLRLENVDVESSLNSKHVRIMSWLKLITVVVKKFSFSILHQVI